MRRASAWFAVAMCLAHAANAEEPPRRSEPPTPEEQLLLPPPAGPVVPTGEDPLWRDRDRMNTDADADQRPPFSDPMFTEGNPDAVVRGSELPPGTTAIFPIGAAAAFAGRATLAFSAFAVGELASIWYEG